MNIYLDRIATVNIDIINPVVEDYAFDKILLVGPGPKTPITTEAGVKAYANLMEMEEDGWVTTGDNPDPVGAGARLAFAQNPIPAKIYVAPMLSTAEAVRFAGVVKEVEDAIKQNMLNASPNGCSLEYDGGKRVMTVKVEGKAVTGISGTGLDAAIKQLTGAGFAVAIDGQNLTSAEDFKKTTSWTSLSKLGEGQNYQFTATCAKTVDDERVRAQFGCVVCYPDSDHLDDPLPEFIGELPTPEDKYEPAVDAIKRAMEDNGWYAVCTCGVDSSEYESIAEFIETQEKIFIYTETDYFKNGMKPTVSPLYVRTAAVFGPTSADQDPADMPPANRYINVAFTTVWFNFEPGSETAANQVLRGVTPGSFSVSNMVHMERDMINHVILIKRQNVTQIGKMLGDEWCDMIRFRDWLKADMQNRIVDVFIKNPKIPYTDQGIALIHNAMEASLKRGQKVGGICFDEYDEEGNTIPGYWTKVPTAASLSAVQRRSRKLTGCTFAARPTGAIHFAEITGSITYEF